ncbi:hypothetical protein [Bailinhaonella thermotolerans]|uniref:Ig-like domain-containing protein n=1 Tax=Bailinhaonella thermotolerans TaxID=1070861 RepID=A0A3A4ADI3_9ACTN|nr:hypothetical protein [Bailinhaonella thermotolerans]RJL24714.1 hypothetical protein D5H75_28360 [Bailinhaonella thermotolerans]
MVPRTARGLSAGAAATALAALTVMAAPASAAVSAPAVTFAYCSAGSTYMVFCEAYWEGGADPATARWSDGRNTWMGPGQYNSATRRTWAGGTCNPGSLFYAKVTITDAAGQVTERLVPGGRACR